VGFKQHAETSEEDAPGTLHHVMIRGMERKRIVEDKGDRREFARRLGRLAVETETAIYAWALMTNHAHILLRAKRSPRKKQHNKRG